MGDFDNLDLVDERGRFCVPEPELVELAERILELYRQLRPNYAPGKVTVPKKALKQFYLAAKLCRRRRQTPEEFVTGQLEGMAQEGSFWPNAIACEKYGKTSQDHNILYVQTVRHYKSQLDTFKKCSSIYGPRLTLLDKVNQFTPLVRYWLAMKHGFEDIAAEYRESAKLEYQAKPAARDAFGDMGSLDGD